MEQNLGSKLATVLRDFSSQEQQELDKSEDIDVGAEASLQAWRALTGGNFSPKPTQAARLESAVQAAVAEREAEFAAQLAELNAKHQAEIEALRKDLSANALQQAYEMFLEGLTRIETELHEELTRFLSLLATDTINQHAIILFARRVGEVAIKSQKPIRVEGNAGLWARLTQLENFDASLFAFSEAPGADLCLYHQDQVISTRLKEFLQAWRGMIK